MAANATLAISATDLGQFRPQDRARDGAAIGEDTMSLQFDLCCMRTEAALARRDAERRDVVRARRLGKMVSGLAGPMESDSGEAWFSEFVRQAGAMAPRALGRWPFNEIGLGGTMTETSPPPSKAARAEYDRAQDLCSREWERLTRSGLSSKEAWAQIKTMHRAAYDIYTRGIGKE